MSRQPSGESGIPRTRTTPGWGGRRTGGDQSTQAVGRKAGHQLAEIRKRLGLTQREVAKALGVSISRISQIEHGATSLEGIARYIEALGGHLYLVAHFGDRIVHLSVSDASATAA